MQTKLVVYSRAIVDYAKQNYKKTFREPEGVLRHKFIVPGSCYFNSLWDLDSWLTNIALRKLDDSENLEEYEKGCILNFLDHMKEDGRMCITLTPRGEGYVFSRIKNAHKPCIAQHALFVCESNHDYEWIREHYAKFEFFIDFYRKKCKHVSGLFFWLDDGAIGIDNDPCTFYRPQGSSASIFLNCLMYRELLAMAELARALGMPDKEQAYAAEAEELCMAVRENCWDERDGFYYNVDINLLPINPDKKLHSGAPRSWNCLIQRIGVWSGFMAMWAGIATPRQAARMVREHYRNKKTFSAPYGVRSLSQMEKMYTIQKSNNPSCWLGPVWGISNYLTFQGLVNYGFEKDAVELATKTIRLFGRDLAENRTLHEYYNPETGIGVNNPDFQGGNLLAVNIIEWLQNREGRA